jgi:excinuclease ABC subunit C
MTLPPELHAKLKNLPEQPGVYRFLNKKGTILYIGKAKSLKKRVNSYFIGIAKHSYRIQHLVENIADVAYTVVNTEVEALILENNLIKNHQPKYNILLKDGKTYPYLMITNERFPKIEVIRKKPESGTTYFGPYVNGGVMYTLLELFKDYIKIRNCNYNLSAENIQAGKFRACLEYQIGNCAAPCVGLQQEAEYNAQMEQVKHILRGNFKPVLDDLEKMMTQAASEYAFEKAELYRKKMEQIIAYRNKNRIVSEKLEDLEVLTVIAEEHLAVVNHFKVHNGAIIQTHSLEVKRNNNETEAEILAAAFGHLLSEEVRFYREIVMSHAPEDENIFADYSLTYPQKGDKKHLLELSLKNCRTLLEEKLYSQNFREKKRPNEVMMEELQKVLHLKQLPDHIECFDNSNFQGSFPVSAMVCFKEGKAAKKEYRHYNVKTVEGPNDFATMAEVVERRYSRLLAENQPLPKLIIIDGGKGQLSSAAEALKKLNLLDKIPMVGIAKRLEEIYSVNDSLPLHIDKKSSALILIQRMRDEAHRFGITFHRDKRSKAVNQRTHLSEIQGIGENTSKKLLDHFRSVTKIKAASETEIAEVIGKHKAGIVVAAIANGEI